MKKRICFIRFSMFSIGGAQRVTLSLANDLCERFDVYLLSLCGSEERDNYFVSEKIKIKSFGMPENMRAKDSFKLFFKVKKFLSENKIDVLFIAGSLPIPLVALLRPFIRCKVVFCDHENIKGRDKKSILFRKIACKISDKIVILTNETKQDYVNLLGAYEKKLVQIYNYIDEALVPENRAYDLSSKKILSVGRLSKEKGFDMALEVAAEVFKAHGDWQWHIYGDGEERNSLLEKAKNLGLEKSVIFKGADPKVIEKYKDYAIYVLPSYREGFAVVLIEAKLNGLPTVSFDCSSGPNEIIEDGVSGFLVPCYDKKLMARKICELIEDEKLRQRFSNHARDNLEKFGKTKVIQKWIALIDEL